ncbi:hypothetical protein G5S42_07995 [Paraburkholderia sp. JPY169]|uniref:DJ-1/PfpI domain-containing protein n=1 Tax=Paraburkholderia youngii TaxID=2782701 RepID=A0A7Y6JWY8_9BURK|nr:hypothetical protein [Paraburkholderia youngii]
MVCLASPINHSPIPPSQREPAAVQMIHRAMSPASHKGTACAYICVYAPRDTAARPPRSLHGHVDVDTRIVGGVIDPLSSPPADTIVAFLRKACISARRIGAICTGGVVLVEAGLLAQRRGATHWASL